MSALNDIVNDLAPMFPEVPTPVISWAVMKAVRRFATDTSALQDTFTFEAQECLQEYLIVTPECVSVTSIISVQRDHGCQVTDDLRWQFEVVNPVVILRDKQKDGTPVTVTYAYAPKGIECSVPDNIYPHYEDLITRLVRANLYGMDNSEWSNPKRGDYERMEYEAEVKHIASMIRNKGRRGPRKMIGSNFLGRSAGLTVYGRSRG
jgi:hypothetical protein